MAPHSSTLDWKICGRRSLVGGSPWGRKESDTTEWLHFHFSLSCIGERNGNPLQYSCKENPWDGGAWWAAVYGVAQSRTWLKWLSSSSSRAITMPKPLTPKGDQSWVFIRRTDVEAETPILWPPDAKSWLIWKDPDAGKDWGQEEKGAAEDEMVGSYHQLNGHGFGWIPGVGDGQGGLVCCGSWGRKESDMTERLNWNLLQVRTAIRKQMWVVLSKKYISHLYGLCRSIWRRGWFSFKDRAKLFLFTYLFLAISHCRVCELSCHTKDRTHVPAE